MRSRSHRVWSAVNVDGYSSSKDFGGEFSQHIAVGSSARYSNHFADVEVRELPIAGALSIFSLWVDGVLAKRAAFNNKTKAYGKIPASWARSNDNAENVESLEKIIERANA